MRQANPARPRARRAPAADLAGRDRLPSLTGLRFWAALLVVLYHLSRQVGEIPYVSDTVWYGRSGVTFFFVLSGFVLAWTYDGKAVPAKVFLWRRFARIWPLMVVTGALSVAVWVWLGQTAMVSAKAVITNLLLVHAWMPDTVKGANPAAWSLSDEAWFYLVFPLLMALPAFRSGRGRRWIWALTCVGVVLVWMSGALVEPGSTRVWALDYLPLSRMLQFVLGVAAGLAVARGWRPPVGLWPAVALTAGWHLALIPWSWYASDADWYGPYHASQLLSTPVFALLVAAAARADLDGRRTGLGGRWAVRLGHWSFAWYLIHEIVIRSWLGTYGRPQGLVDTALVWLLVIVVSQALSGLAYHGVEHPLERLLRGAGPQVPRPAVPRPAAEPSAEPARTG
ncbi:acyltransferase [Streptomyces sp. CC77]|uniref:acyltransferase family protein n=1 Tax=Streptomyces sp. CC77 TaxID=1906739 RepID=UPI0008DCB267|nr:acyltransferase [Streptomyces sp. CC77]OII67128.1 acyltransferase [Streptomyces sp. CC77]